MSSRNRCNRASWSALNAQQRQTKTPHIWKPQQPPCRRRQDKRATARLRACVKPAALFAKADLPSSHRSAKPNARHRASPAQGTVQRTKPVARLRTLRAQVTLQNTRRLIRRARGSGIEAREHKTCAGGSSGWNNAAGPAPQAKRHDPPQQLRITDPDVTRGCGELLAFGDFGIWIGFQKIRRAVGGQAEIDPGIAVEFKRPIDALCQPLDVRRQFRRQILGGTMQNAAALLITRVMFDLFGGDQPIALRHVLELQLPNRQHQQAIIADDANIDFPAFDVLLGNSGSTDAFVNEFYALDELIVAVDH